MHIVFLSSWYVNLNVSVFPELLKLIELDVFDDVFNNFPLKCQMGFMLVLDNEQNIGMVYVSIFF
jgi:hypothetical protein